MIIFYTFFFTFLNFFVYKLIKYNSKLSFQITFIFIFFVLITLSIKIYKVFYTKSQMMNGFTFFVLLTFSFLICIINLFNTFQIKNFKRRLKNNENLSSFSNQFIETTDYILIITIIVTLIQLFIIWSKTEFSN